MLRRALIASNRSVSLQQTAVPVARSASDCLVQTKAFGLNALDFAMSRDSYGAAILDRLRGAEYVLGQELSGVVVETGPNVFDLRVGDEVFGAVDPWSRCGTAATFVRVNECDLALKPKKLSFETAASLPFAAMSVWRSVIVPAMQKRAKTALVFGGLTGNVGVVTAALLEEFVPGIVVTAVGREGYEGDGMFDVVVDASSVNSSPDAQPLPAEGLVAPGGIYTTLNGRWLRQVDQEGAVVGSYRALQLLFEKKSVNWVRKGATYNWGVMFAAGNDALSHIAARIDEGRLAKLVDRPLRILPFDDNLLNQWDVISETKGKTVIKV